MSQPRRPLPHPAHGPDQVRDSGGAGTAGAWRELYETCCLTGWESRGSLHDPGACPGRTAA
ncbi:hypothetical protein [Streptomyces sp. SID10815]|uniref:hypothetical protein n=1 Tax=Streptomyces sp. SID10815 TaxID=2706027 RepID=UPI0013C61CB5|nr:hypothetical protein [Streptomyces sp. SID10815]NEA50907.1 hypothetical protein [Streptomyces sp. SID10815]